MIWLRFARSWCVLGVLCGLESCDEQNRCEVTANWCDGGCVEGCSGHVDCPAGTICASRGLPEDNTCQLPLGQSARDALISGFQVEHFDLQRTDQSPLVSFTWDPPEDARIVQCALFACRPDVRVDDCESVPTKYKIVNYGTCAIAAQTFEPANGLFDLGDANHELEREDDDEAATLGNVVTELLVGCWAYDASTVIAATPLEPLLPDEIYNYRGQFDPDCSGAETDTTCILDRTLGELGICDGLVCRRPCVVPDDCGPPPAAPRDGGVDATMSTEQTTDPADASRPGDASVDAEAGGATNQRDGGGTDANTPVWSCDRREGAFVGVCRLPQANSDQTQQVDGG